MWFDLLISFCLRRTRDWKWWAHIILAVGQQSMYNTWPAASSSTFSQLAYCLGSSLRWFKAGQFSKSGQCYSLHQDRARQKLYICLQRSIIWLNVSLAHPINKSLSSALSSPSLLSNQYHNFTFFNQVFISPLYACQGWVDIHHSTKFVPFGTGKKKCFQSESQLSKSTQSSNPHPWSYC